MAPGDGDGDGPWRSAVVTLVSRLRGSGEAGLDCRTIAIWLEAHDAVLVFTTRDGRQAMRRLQSPDELGAVVDALAVTLPPAPAPPVAAPLLSPLSRQPSEAPLRAPGAAGLFVQFAAGGRISGDLASPSLALRAGVLLRDWELTAFAQWDPAYAALAGGAPPSFAMSRYSAGVGLGRRVAVGGVEVAFGLMTSMGVVEESGEEDELVATGSSSHAHSQSSAEPTVAAYLGALWPRRSLLRARAELSADAVVSRLGTPLVLDDSLPALPWWSSVLSFGIEWELP